MDRDVLDLIEKRQIPVYVIAEDLADRGVEASELVPGVQVLSRNALPLRRIHADLPLVAAPLHTKHTYRELIDGPPVRQILRTVGAPWDVGILPLPVALSSTVN